MWHIVESSAETPAGSSSFSRCEVKGSESTLRERKLFHALRRFDGPLRDVPLRTHDVVCEVEASRAGCSALGLEGLV